MFDASKLDQSSLIKSKTGSAPQTSTAAGAVNEIAFFLGYSEPSPFYRAFQQWTGMSPLDYRRSRDASSRGRTARATAAEAPADGKRAGR